MAYSFGTRLKHAWNAFFNKDPTSTRNMPTGTSYSHRPDRPRMHRGNERTIVTAVFNRIAMDVASLSYFHTRHDDNDRYVGNIASGLNNCLTVEANIDQTARAFIQDYAMSLLDEGAVAIVPVDTTSDPRRSNAFDVITMRVGRILEWYPQHVKVRVYNESSGEKEDVVLPKRTVGIIENPLFAVCNEPNSTLQRLIRKLNILDVIDEQSSSSKLDLIIQLPYTLKSPARQVQAENRRSQIEDQLMNSKYGIAYIDGTEKVIQLNRAVENNLMTQIEFLTNLLYSQLGITKEVMDGSADEKTMLNYTNRTIEPIASAFTDELKRKFLSKTARTQKQSVDFFRDPFKLIPVSELAEIADKMTRNEIMSSNEVRQKMGMIPSDDPKADELRNKNLNESNEEVQADEMLYPEELMPAYTEEEINQNG